MRRLLSWFLCAVLTLAPTLASATQTYTVGVGGAYADFNALNTALTGGSLPSAVTGGVQVDNIVVELEGAGITTGTTQVYGPWTAGVHTTLIKPVPGQGFQDYKVAHPGITAYYNPTYGAFIYYLSVSGSTNQGLEIDNVDNVTIFGIQIQTTAGAGGNNSDYIYITGSGITNITIDSNVLGGLGGHDTAPGIFGAASITSTALLLLQRNLITGVVTDDLYAVKWPGACTVYSNTIAAPLITIDQGAGISCGQPGVASSMTVNNNAFIGFAQGVGGEGNGWQIKYLGNGSGQSASHNAASTSAFIDSTWGTSAQVSVAGSAAFNNAGSATNLWDYRLLSSSPLKGNGGGSGLPSTDIYGNAVNSPPDIGAIAYNAGDVPIVTTSVKTGAVLNGDTLPDGEVAFSVPPDFDPSHNTEFAIGPGGPGANLAGAGGGEFCQNTNRSYVPGNLIAISVPGVTGLGVTPPPTTFSTDLIANGGVGAYSGSGNGPYAGGTGGTGDTCHDGGAGTGVINYANGAAGGAGGPHGAGATAGNIGAAGGGAADNGTAGADSSGSTGGVGGTAQDGTLGGAGGTVGTPTGGTGSHGSGGGGGYTATTGAGAGGAGGNGITWLTNTGVHSGSSYGPGGGGGEGGTNFPTFGGGTGGAGGLCGGGGGATGYQGTSTTNLGGAGCFIYQYGQASAPSTGNLLVGGWP